MKTYKFTPEKLDWLREKAKSLEIFPFPGGKSQSFYIKTDEGFLGLDKENKITQDILNLCLKIREYKELQ